MLLLSDCIRMRSWCLSSSREAFFKRGVNFHFGTARFDMKSEAKAKLFSCVVQMLQFGSSPCMANVLRVQTFLRFTSVFRSMDQMRLSGTMVLYDVCVLWISMAFEIWHGRSIEDPKTNRFNRCPTREKLQVRSMLCSLCRSGNLMNLGVQNQRSTLGPRETPGTVKCAD